MIRISFIFLATFAMTLGLRADPVKKTPTDNSEKLCKECAEAFIKALMDGKADDAVKLCATPFREATGEKFETLDKLKKEFESGVPQGLEIKAVSVMTLAKFNEETKASEVKKEIPAERIKEYEEYIGKEGRIVLLEVNKKGDTPPPNQRPHFLVRVKDGKAYIVGIGS